MSTYRLAETIPTDVRDALSPDVTVLAKQLLYTRGVTDLDAVQRFLSPDYETGRHDPFLLNDMEMAVERVLKAIENKEQIAIFSDYDCDGIPGAVVLHDFFKMIGYAYFQNYIPHRHYEGFGLSAEAVGKLQKDNVKLIITIDCGTTNIDAVAAANEVGIDVIVTDHHEAKETLPKAHAIVNPKVGDTYPFDGLCGSGVVFKLVEALIQKGNFDLKPGQEKWLLDMVGIATIADMVPLVGENRVFATYGLQVLRKSRRPGIQQLLKKARASQKHLTEDDVGFTIGPRINAASRMDTPEDAFLMLAATTVEDASVRVEHIEKLNNERKGMVASMTKELHKRTSEMIDVPDVIVMGNPAWRPSLVGLAANSLSSEYKRPVFLWGRDGNGVIKGSCRSGGSVSIITLMNEVSDAFLEHGGHHVAGGFAVHDEHIFSLPEKLNDAFKKLGSEVMVDEEVIVDASISLGDVNKELLETLSTLAPYGIGNPKPLFEFKKVVPKRVETFGKTKEHLKLVFEGDGASFEAITFFKTPESYSYVPKVGEELTLIAHVEQSYFMNRLQTRLRIVDIIKDSV